MKQSCQNLKQDEGGEREISLVNRLCTPGSSQTCTRRSSMRENPFWLVSWFAEAGKSSITKIRLQVSTASEGITESQYLWLIWSKGNRALSREQVGVEAEQGVMMCVDTGPGGGQDQCVSHWARPKGGQITHEVARLTGTSTLHDGRVRVFGLSGETHEDQGQLPFPKEIGLYPTSQL